MINPPSKLDYLSLYRTSLPSLSTKRGPSVRGKGILVVMEAPGFPPACVLLSESFATMWYCTAPDIPRSHLTSQQAALFCSILPGKSTGVGGHLLLQGIFPTQGSKLGLPHYRQTLLLSDLPGKWFNACTVVRSGNFRVSNSFRLLFGQNQSLFIKPTIVKFQILFFLF